MLRRFAELTPEEKFERSMDLLWELDERNPKNKPPFSTTHPGPMLLEHLELFGIVFSKAAGIQPADEKPA